MGNPGSIEKVMVFGILMIILGILAVAIYGNEQPAALGAGPSRFGSEGQVPTKPTGPRMNAVEPERDSRRESPIHYPQNDLGPAPPVEEVDFKASNQPRDVTSGDPGATLLGNPKPAVDGAGAKPAAEPQPPPKATPPAAPRTYVVKGGDNLTTIARDQLGDANRVDAIIAANPSIKGTTIFVGQKLTLPPADVAAGAGPAEPETKTPPQTKPQPPKPGDDGVEKLVKKAPSTYTIQKDDNLIGISRRFYGNVKMVEPILKANRDVIKDKNNLPAGKTIKLP